MFLKLLKNDLKVSRFSFVVGQKVSKRANIRNRTKRKMRAVIKKELVKIKPGLDIVLVAISLPGGKNGHETERTVKLLLQKSGICR